MKTSELEKNTKVINLVGTIESLKEIETTPGGQKVREGILTDDTGQVKISLWAEDTDKYKVGDKILMSAGWCKEFPKDGGEMQVSAGKFGKISIVPPEKPEE